MSSFFKSGIRVLAITGCLLGLTACQHKTTPYPKHPSHQKPTTHSHTVLWHCTAHSDTKRFTTIDSYLPYARANALAKCRNHFENCRVSCIKTGEKST